MNAWNKFWIFFTDMVVSISRVIVFSSLNDTQIKRLHNKYNIYSQNIQHNQTDKHLI